MSEPQISSGMSSLSSSKSVWRLLARSQLNLIFRDLEHMKHENHPPFFLNIEGQEFPWHAPTITTEEIASLGGWPADTGVIEIDKDNNEHTLTQGEVVDLKPGHGFAKKVKWKRGDNLHDQRLAAEHAILMNRFGDVEYSSGWFLIPGYPTYLEGWNRRETHVAIQAPVGYPAAPPYGIYVQAGLRFKDAPPSNYQESVGNRPPFDGEWAMFSWAPGDGEWRPSADIHAGSNLLNFALGIAKRFQEGA